MQYTKAGKSTTMNKKIGSKQPNVGYCLLPIAHYLLPIYASSFEPN
jgi:hypothetical protein